MKKLTIGMIIKNESANLERCLNAIKPILEKVDSELVIVDTGSSDNSVEIAKKYTDRVYNFVWINDFAAARNESLKYATGEWFMYLDGDEYLESPDEVINFFNSGEYKKYEGASYIQRNFSEPDSEKIYSDSYVLRAFKIKNNVKFHGYIHEAINTEEMRGLKMLSKTAFKHWGYCIDKDVEKYKKKLSDYEELLKKEIAANPTDSIRYSQLAAIYNGHSNFEENTEEEFTQKAVECLQKAVEVESKKDLVCAYYKMIAKILFNIKKYNECKKFCDSYFEVKNKSNIDIIGSDADIYFYSGFCCFETNDFEFAIKNLKKYLEIYKKMQSGEFKTVELLTVGNMTDTALYFYFAVQKLLDAFTKIKDVSEIDKYIDMYLSEDDKKNQSYVCNRINTEFKIADILNDETRINKIIEKYSVYDEIINDYVIRKIEERFKERKNKKQLLEILINCNSLNEKYKNLSRLRYADITNSEIDWSCLEFFFASDGYLDALYGDILYFSVKYGVNFDDIATLIDYNKVSEYIAAFSVSAEDMNKAMYARTGEDMSESDVAACIIYIELCREYMLEKETNQNERIEFFARFANISFEYISLILNMENLNENSAYILPIALREMYLSGFAYVEFTDGNYQKAIEYIDKIAEFSPRFKVLSDSVYAMMIKVNICELIKANEVESARMLADQYRVTYGEDREIDDLFEKIN